MAFLAAEAAGIIRPSSSPPSQIKGGRRRCAPALSHHFVVRLNPLRGFIPSSSQKPKKATLSGDLFWFFGGGGGNYSGVALTPPGPPSLRSRVVSPLRGSAEPAARVHSQIIGQ